MTATLASEIVAFLSPGYVVELLAVCMDVSWPPITEDEFFHADPAVSIRVRDRVRQATFQRVRSEIRYILLSEGHDRSPSDHEETGIVATPRDAALLCTEYLESELSLEQLTATRTTYRRS
jgi:hypothetical protein